MSILYNDVPLDQPKQQIRLLRLVSGDAHNDQAAEYSLEAFQFDVNCPEYIAISYTWGDVAPNLPITVNGQVLPIRLNCWYAVWQMSLHNPGWRVWIDSICINQSNNEEKNAQVAMMGSIYQRANHVASCLGQGDVLRWAREALKYTTVNEPSYSDGKANAASGVHTDKVEEHDRDPSGLISRVRQCLELNPYFDRIWIKQEVILARQVMLCAGTDTMLLDEIAVLVDKSTVKLSTICSHRSSIQRREGAESGTSWDSFATNDKSAIIKLLHQYGDAACHDPRDKVYALLSLVPEHDLARTAFKIDYSLPLFDFFRQSVAVLCQLGPDHSQDIPPLARKMAVWFNADPAEGAAKAFLCARLSGPLPIETQARFSLEINSMTYICSRFDRPCGDDPSGRVEERVDSSESVVCVLTSKVTVSIVPGGILELERLPAYTKAQNEAYRLLIPFRSTPFSDSRDPSLTSRTRLFMRGSHFMAYLVDSSVQHGDSLAWTRFEDSPGVVFRPSKDGSPRSFEPHSWAWPVGFADFQFFDVLEVGTPSREGLKPNQCNFVDSLPRQDVWWIPRMPNPTPKRSWLSLHADDVVALALGQRDQMVEFLNQPVTTQPCAVTEDFLDQDYAASRNSAIVMWTYWRRDFERKVYRPSIVAKLGIDLN